MEKDELSKKIMGSNSEHLRLEDWGMVPLEVRRLEEGTLTESWEAGGRMGRAAGNQVFQTYHIVVLERHAGDNLQRAIENLVQGQG